ncbi:MFS transporter [Candidatus Halobonum tyrrellensis]|uniref:Major facilitator superfamily MFS_1 n=1 Tax=Candidatus Halobonum tyrrellensis G22 TaxID=1324957 RepID=V4GSC6_9EURY|nr:MFS transporter [Candidatus Halobonum tyrrellensis]ESP87991.1 major facilitator superfamily MFS_1 [Candidatus Halobonum tyrrellensis G22]
MGVAARLGRLSEYDALALTALVWFLAKFLRYAFPPLFPRFGVEFGVSNALLGTAYTVMMTVYALMQFPSGALADRLGATKVIVGGGLVAAAGALWLVVPVPRGPVFALPWAGAVPAGFLALVGGMVLVGLGTGAHKTVAVRLLSRTYPARTGRALGVLDTLGAFGGVAAPAAVVLFTDVADWHALFLAGGLAGVGLAAAVLARVPRRVPPTPTDADGGGTPAGAYLALFRDRRFALFVLVTLCFSFGYNGAVAFLPSFLVAVGDLPTETANLLYSGLFVVSLVQLVTGDLSDRVGHLRVIGATLALAAAGIAGLLVVGAAGPVVLGAVVVAFGLGSHGFRPVRGAYLTAVIPDEVAGGGLGVVRTLLMGAGALSPAVVGVIADASGFAPAFGLLAAAMALAVLLTGVVAVLGDDATAA